MKMLARLRYLLEEGFEVGHVSGYDAAPEGSESGVGRITYVRKDPGGKRRLVTEEFVVDEEEARLCGELFLRRPKGS